MKFSFTLCGVNQNDVILTPQNFSLFKRTRKSTQDLFNCNVDFEFSDIHSELECDDVDSQYASSRKTALDYFSFRSRAPTENSQRTRSISSLQSSNIEFQRYREICGRIKFGRNTESKKVNDEVDVETDETSIATEESNGPKQLTGSLEVQGQIFKSWKLRHFALKDGTITCYANESLEDQIGASISLWGYTLSTPNVNQLFISKPDDDNFDDSDEDLSLTVKASNDEEYAEWAAAIAKHIKYINITCN